MSKKYNAVANSEKDVSQTFLKGAAILTLSMVIVKVFGLLDKILLTNIYSMFGDDVASMGMGLYSNAYEIFVVILLLQQEDCLLQFLVLFHRIWLKSDIRM